MPKREDPVPISMTDISPHPDYSGKAFWENHSKGVLFPNHGRRVPIPNWLVLAVSIVDKLTTNMDFPNSFYVPGAVVNVGFGIRMT